MKDFMAKIWVPALLVMIAAVQSFGIDAGRAVGLRRSADSLRLSSLDDSSALAGIAIDSSAASLPDSLETPADDSMFVLDFANDSTAADTLEISPKDTIKVPDSLRLTDPFKFKYYIAIKDTSVRAAVRDFLLQAGDTLEVHRLDSLYIKDSTETAAAEFQAWYSSLTRRERKKYDAEQKLPALIAAANRKTEIKDSIRAHKDSIIEATPRVLETFAFPDSMHYKRIVTWNHDRYFNDVRNLRDQWADTSYNHNFHEYPFFKKDVNASYLGVIGSPVQLYDYFKRQEEDNAIFYTPYQIYSYTADNLPQYNTKTPYTELAYWGTLFANKDKEESNIKILTTQNITPELNLTLEYHRFGGNGMLKREDTDTRTVVAAVNYTGKKYLMHTGYIYDRIEKSENGGVIDPMWIRDTVVDAREIDVYLRDASNKLKKNTLFLDQTYRIPFSFKSRAERLEEKRKDAVRDSILASGDSTAIAALKAKEEAELALAAQQADTAGINTDVTTAFIGHSSEYSVFRKTYTDVINSSDAAGREFYHDRFYINPTTSMDSLRVMRLENRVFLRLQPWKDDAVVSKVDVGIGDKLLNHYSFRPSDYLQGSSNVLQNSVYLYAGANGQFKRYLTWNAKGDYTFLGKEINDFGIEANLTAHAYPFRRDRKSPLTFNAHFETSLREPDYYEQHLYTNHYKWDNDFSKISKTKVEASLSIPRWKLAASFGYALLNNNIYYDTLGVVQQNIKPMSVMSATLKKNFRLWKLHLDHTATFQLSSNEEVMPLPMLALNLRYYLQFDVVKNAMQMQIGANGTFTTKWYAPAYNPVLGVFHNQNVEKYGNSPYIDVFVNIQWKRVSLFVKAVNVNMGWPMKKADYFSAAGYIAPQRAIKFGISWPFWTLAGKNSSTGVSGSSASGGSRSSAGLNGGGPSPGGRSSSGSSRQSATNVRR